MPKISLATYSIDVHELRNPGRLPIGSFDGEHDLLDCFAKYCTAMQLHFYHDEDDRRLLRVERLDSDHAGHVLYGLLRRGEYGYEAQLYDVNRDAPSYARGVDDAELIPFYFLIHLPPDADRGIAILQRFGNSGIRTDFYKSLSRAFVEEFPDFRIDFQPLIPRDLLRHYLDEGSIKAIEFTRFSLPPDIADVVGAGGFSEELGSVKVSLTTKRNRVFPEPPWLRRLARGETFQDILELRESNYEELRIQVKLGSTVRTLEFTDLSKIRGYFNISDEVRMEDGGHPDYDNIHEHALSLLDDMRDEVIFTHVNEAERDRDSN